MNQLSLKDCSVRINGIRQNCYALDTRENITDTKSSKIIKKYDSLERKDLSNGFVEQVVQVDYPINPDSISSYVDGADYRRDPMQAIANTPSRVNLGDIREVQSFVADNPQNAVRVLRDVISMLENRVNQMSAQNKQNNSIENVESKGV